MLKNTQGMILLVTLVFSLCVVGQTQAFTPSFGEKTLVATGGGMAAGAWDHIGFPSVAINEAGFIAIAWTDYKSREILLQIYAPNGRKAFEKPVNISNTPQVYSWFAKIAITSTNPFQVYAIWQEVVGPATEIFFARSTDGGKIFTAPLNLSKDPQDSGRSIMFSDTKSNGNFDIAVDSEGNIYVIWTESEGRLLFSLSTNQGMSFSSPTIVDKGSTMNPRFPTVTIDAKGIVYIAWADGGNKTGDIHFSKSTDQGRTFSKPLIIYHNSGFSDAPRIAIDNNDTIHLVSDDNTNAPIGYINYTRSNNGGQSFIPPKNISNPLNGGFPHISIDKKNNIYVKWGLYPHGAGFNFSTDGGQSFAGSSVIPGSIDTKSGQTLSGIGRELAVNSTGDIAIAFSELIRGQASYIWLIRGRAAHINY